MNWFYLPETIKAHTHTACPQPSKELVWATFIRILYTFEKSTFMKKPIFIFILFICTFSVQGQSKNGISVEIDANYFHYFMGENTGNNFNYGFSFLVSRTQAGVKISTGIEYATKDYYFQYPGPTGASRLIKRNFRMQYANIPFLVTVRVKKTKKLNISGLSGLVLKKLLSYDIVSSYADQPRSEEIIEVPKAPGLSARLGLQFSVQTGKKMNVIFAPFTEISLVSSSNGDEGPNYNNGIPNQLLSFGIKVGIEYPF